MIMPNFMKIAGVFASLALLSACASTAGPDVDTTAEPVVDTTPEPQGPIPGSQADLEQNAGHRVFFAYDQYTLTRRSGPRLSRQPRRRP